MTAFRTVTLDFAECRKQIEEFGALLTAHMVLKERKTILPFFGNREQLSAFCGHLSTHIGTPDRVAWEYRLFGDFQCDLVIGDWARKAYYFVEFEDAGPTSVFTGKKQVREWSSRFDHGYSQIVDWFYKIADRRQSDEHEARFGKRTIEYEGLLVVGRDRFLDLGERLRLEWRRDRMLLDSKKIACMTFDEFYRELVRKWNSFALVGGLQQL